MKKILFLIPLLAIASLAGCARQAKESQSQGTSMSESYDDSSSKDSSSDSSSSGGSSSSSSIDEDLPEDVDEYYSSITTETGNDLLNALNTLNNSKRKKMMGYDNMRYLFKYTDRADGVPDNKIVGFYDNASLSADWDSGKTWNREHVWPNSRGGKNVFGNGAIDADMHMVRPASVSVNSGRGNLFFAATGAYDPGNPLPNYRGISARIIFYCAIADKRLSLVDKADDNSDNHTMGKLSDLLKWNLEYLPSRDSNAALELRVEQFRNEAIFTRTDLQGNRNPFIDHPEYACKIWGNTNDATRNICKGLM